jgi:CopG family nickel-responsive transcriptional regulator
LSIFFGFQINVAFFCFIVAQWDPTLKRKPNLEKIFCAAAISNTRRPLPTILSDRLYICLVARTPASCCLKGFTNMERITITIDDDLLAIVDAMAARRGFPSRSEAVRELLREVANRDHSNAGRAPCVATLTYVFDHEIRDLSQRLVNAQHDHHDYVIATTHVHFDHDTCLEVAVLRGPGDAIRSLADRITTQRGVRHGSLHIMPLKTASSRHSHEPGTPPHSHSSV